MLDKIITQTTKIIDDRIELVVKKNSDYSGYGSFFSNFENSLTVGVPVEKGMWIRTADKVSRIKTLIKKKAEVENESLEDSINDLVGYCLLINYWFKKSENSDIPAYEEFRQESEKIRDKVRGNIVDEMERVGNSLYYKNSDIETSVSAIDFFMKVLATDLEKQDVTATLVKIIELSVKMILL